MHCGLIREHNYHFRTCIIVNPYSTKQTDKVYHNSSTQRQFWNLILKVFLKEANVAICKIDSQWEFAVWLRELKQGLCKKLEGWDGEEDGREVWEGVPMMILVDVWQKTTKFCKAIILQLKKNYVAIYIWNAKKEVNLISTYLQKKEILH